MFDLMKRLKKKRKKCCRLQQHCWKLLENDHLNDVEKLAQFVLNNNNAMVISMQFVCMFDEFPRREKPLQFVSRIKFQSR